MAQTHTSPSQARVNYCGSDTGDCRAPPEDKLYGLGVPERVDVRKAVCGVSIPRSALAPGAYPIW